jgi:hypothetical protein
MTATPTRDAKIGKGHVKERASTIAGGEMKWVWVGGRERERERGREIWWDPESRAGEPTKFKHFKRHTLSPV